MSNLHGASPQLWDGEREGERGREIERERERETERENKREREIEREIERERERTPTDSTCLLVETAPSLYAPVTSKQPIRTRYLGHVTGYQPIRDQQREGGDRERDRERSEGESERREIERVEGERREREGVLLETHHDLVYGVTQVNNQSSNSLFRSRDWLSANQGPVFLLNQMPHAPVTSKQPIRTRYLGHVTGYQPIRDQYSC
eukprot:sb/3470412/